MIGFLKAIVLLPIALVVVLLAIANRDAVVFSLDPFSRGAPEIAVTLPLFALLFAAAALGVVLGGVGAWLGGGKHRRARRRHAREVERLTAERDRLRASMPPGTGIVARPARG